VVATGETTESKCLLVTEKIEESHQFGRGRMETLVCLLENLRSSVQIDSTQILGLNAPKLDLYLNFLVETGFVKKLRRENKIVNYEIADKGKEFLKDYNSLKSIVEKTSI